VTEVQGEYDERFAAVAQALGDALEAGDAGGSAAVFVAGEPVVDVWGGYSDANRTRGWERDTIVNVFSVTKTMTALCALILMDRGLLNPDAPVGYHSVTQGFLVGELVRRITGRSIGDFFAAEVAGPLDADFWIALPAEHDRRVALMISPAGREEDYTAGSSAQQAPATGGTPMSVRDANSAEWRRAEIPAASGFGNARSVALIQSVMACGGTLGPVRLLGPETCELAWAEQFSGEDRVLGMPVSWGLGYGRLGGTYGWGGWGGALVMIDPTRQLVVAYATNQMREPAHDDRGMQIAMAALSTA
jgi:CubicO group peptidase (beta-lactamase class C family)